MRRLLLTGIAFTALIAGSAMAADLAPRPVYRAPVAVVAPFTWSGFYLGIQGGSGWGTSEWNTTSVTDCTPAGGCAAFASEAQSASYNLNGWHGGGTAGYNWQIGQTVLGIEGDISAANINGRGDCTAANNSFFFSNMVKNVGEGVVSSCHTDLKWLATLTGRVGFAVDHALWYVKGGIAWAHFNQDITSAALQAAVGSFSISSASFSTTRTGGTFGVGVEYAFWDNWSAKLEYDYMDFGTESLTYAQPVLVAGQPFSIHTVTTDIRERVHVVRAGINYRFNWAPAPVVTK